MEDITKQNLGATTGSDKTPEVPTNLPKPPQDPKKVHRRAIRTYYSDIAETVKGQDVSMTDIALAEKKRQEDQSKTMVPEPETEKKNRSWGVFAIVTAIVLIIGGGGIFAFLYFYLPQQDEVLIEPLHTTLVPTSQEILIDITGLPNTEILKLIDEESSKLDGTLNTIITLIPTERFGEQEKLLSAREFLNRLNTSAGTALLRSVLEEYSLGVHLFDKNHGFLIIKTDFFENAFAGMLRWESRLAKDLPFLTQPESENPEPQATTTNGSGSVILEPIERYEFKDVVVANRDARALINTVTGDMKMIYSFPDKNTLIITTNPNTLVELFDILTVVRRQ